MEKAAETSHHEARKFLGCRTMMTLSGCVLDVKAIESDMLMDKRRWTKFKTYL